jgi:hypothetical protein
MEPGNPWIDLNERYEYDSEAQFLVFVEQYAEAAALAGSDEISKQRMALVAADNLAELLLHRHKTSDPSFGFRKQRSGYSPT